jgi:tellurite resistance protein TehA-like permease
MHVCEIFTSNSRVCTRRAPYNITWWGCIFPFVTQLSSTYQLYIDTQFGFFLWVGRIWCICICMMAVYVHVKTWRRVISGTIWEQFKPKTG